MIKLETAPTALLASMGALMVSLVTILIHDSDEDKSHAVQPNILVKGPQLPIVKVSTAKEWQPHSRALANNTERFYPDFNYYPDHIKQSNAPVLQAPVWIQHEELMHNHNALESTTNLPSNRARPSQWRDSIYYTPPPQTQPRDRRAYESSNAYDSYQHYDRGAEYEYYVPRTSPSAYSPHFDSASFSSPSQHLYAPTSSHFHRPPSAPQHNSPASHWGKWRSQSKGTYHPSAPRQPYMPSAYPYYSAQSYYYRSR